MEKGVLAGVVVFVVFVILLTNAASVYLFLRGRGRVGNRRETGPASKK